MTAQQAFDQALEHHRAGRLADAEALYRQILAAQPNHADALHLLGVIAHQTGRNDLAVQWIRQAIVIDPNPFAHSNLGEACRAMGRLDEAIANYRHALKLKPDYAEAHNNLGIALRDIGQIDEAVAAWRHALELKPDYPEALNNLGNTLRERGQLDEAIAAFVRALELNPRYPEAHNNLGNALKDQGELDGAIHALRHALQLKPDLAEAHGNLIYTLHFHPDFDGRAIAEEQQRWNRRFSDPFKPLVEPYANDRRPDRPLRIGYVSPYFREHVVGRYLLPLFERHDRRNFEILCYSGVVRPDKLTKQFRDHALQWRGAVGVSDEDLAKMIREDGIDILVDLTQHLAGNRLPMFARQPAPVQASFAGYPESTGLEAIEYRISDRYLERNRQDGDTHGKERVCLIDSFWCFDPGAAETEIHPLPALETGTVTFGCLNNFCKVNERVLRLWARVLGKVKNSRLVLSSPAGSHRMRTLEGFERKGIETHRVEFVDFRPWLGYLEFYHRLDIALDTFPYNGGVTSCDALWMGVPVVSLAGEAPVSRAGLSLLSNLGLPELIAHSETEYVNIAESLATDLPRLAQLRATLRDRMKNSVIMDATRFARQIEEAYREMWKTWLARQSPVHE